MTPESLDTFIDDLVAGRLEGEIPPHGTVARVRQHIPADRGVGALPPEAVEGAPLWVSAATTEASK